MQETAYIIKQDGMPLGHTIRWRILNAGFDIVANKYLKLPMAAFEEIYPRKGHYHVPEEAWRFNVLFNTTGTCEVGILRADGAIQRFLDFTGVHSNPMFCEVGTIRREYGVVRANVIGGYPIHLKVLHRSKNAREAERDLSVIRSLLGA